MLRLCEPVSDIFHLRTSPVIRKQLAVENKLFNFSVGDNERGKFMRIAECSFGPPSGCHSLVIPACGQSDSGWAILRDSIYRVCVIEHNPPAEVSVHGPATIVGPGAGPPVLFSLVSDALVLKVGQIKIFFDPGENAKGDYLRITKLF
eukprot:jgi/Chrzof1/4278/Cz14g06030.t1